jgi:hypothetical protein
MISCTGLFWRPGPGVRERESRLAASLSLQLAQLPMERGERGKRGGGSVARKQDGDGSSRKRKEKEGQVRRLCCVQKLIRHGRDGGAGKRRDPGTRRPRLQPNTGGRHEFCSAVQQQRAWGGGGRGTQRGEAAGRQADGPTGRCNEHRRSSTYQFKCTQWAARVGLASSECRVVGVVLAAAGIAGVAKKPCV